MVAFYFKLTFIQTYLPTKWTASCVYVVKMIVITECGRSKSLLKSSVRPEVGRWRLCHKVASVCSASIIIDESDESPGTSPVISVTSFCSIFQCTNTLTHSLRDQ